MENWKKFLRAKRPTALMIVFQFPKLYFIWKINPRMIFAVNSGVTMFRIVAIARQV